MTISNIIPLIINKLYKRTAHFAEHQSLEREPNLHQVGLSEGFGAQVYPNNLKNRDFDKEAAQIFASGASSHCQRQDASEDQKFAAKLTASKTDSSGCLGIKGACDCEGYL